MSPPVRVAVQGVPGCFSHAAAVQLAPEIELVPCHGFPELFDAIREGRADRGMVPVENALAGAVVENLDLLVRTGLPVVSESFVRVEMCLVSRPGGRLRDLTGVGSHPMALRQCDDFFARHPQLRRVVAYDTAGAIQELMDGEPDYDAAIGPALAAELYGAEILQRGIQNHPDNFTRFLVIAREPIPEGDGRGNKASLAFVLPHRPGALHTALGFFADRGLDLTRLESRPIRGRPWEYRFYADVRAEPGEAFEEALTALRAFSSELRLLGRYTAAALPRSRAG